MSSLVKLSVLLVILVASSFGHCRRYRPRDTSTGDASTDDIKKRIEHPLVQALSPRGLRVSVPHFPGMELFAFHGNINSPIRYLEAGSLSKDVLRTKFARWVFEDKTVQLRVGDVINYWVFAQVNGVGHRVDNLSAIIKDLIPNDSNEDFAYGASAHESSNHESSNHGVSNNEESANIDPQPLPQAAQLDVQSSMSIKPSMSYAPPPSAPKCPECTCQKDQLDDMSLRLNMTLTELNDLQSKIAPLEKEISTHKALIEEITSDLGTGTKLLLVGQQPPRGNPLEAVRNLITDKLELFDLEEKIQSAQKTGSGISFEMSSPLDKKRILLRAKKRLAKTNYKIIDPTDQETLVSGQYLMDERLAENSYRL